MLFSLPPPSLPPPSIAASVHAAVPPLDWLPGRGGPPERPEQPPPPTGSVHSRLTQSGPGRCNDCSTGPSPLPLRRRENDSTATVYTVSFLLFEKQIYRMQRMYVWKFASPLLRLPFTHVTDRWRSLAGESSPENTAQPSFCSPTQPETSTNFPCSSRSAWQIRTPQIEGVCSTMRVREGSWKKNVKGKQLKESGRVPKPLTHTN